jgi:fatty-acyl-CoA synthase
VSWEIDWLKNRAQMTPNKRAVVDGETKETWNYSQINIRANGLASYFKSLGIKKGDRVALLSPNHICYFDLYFACEKIGAIFVPLNWRLSKNEIDYIFHNCTPSFLFFHPEVAMLTGGFQSPLIDVTSEEYEQIVTQGASFSPESPISNEEPLAIIYTGGTTGRPKGVVLTHQSIFCNTTNTVFSWNLNGNDTTVTFLPMFHTGGLFALTMPLLQIGGTVVIGRKFEPNQVVPVLNKEACTIILLVPTMHHVLTQSDAFKQTTFPSMHTFLSGGAPCSHVIYDAYAKKGLTFKEGYGLTEAGPNNFYIDPKDVPLKPGSVGKPMLYNEVKLITASGEEVGIDEVGEIVIKGYHVFDCYWNNVEQTRETKINGWLYTGDLGKKDKDGYYYIVGRKKEMIISGGENIYPLEVEHAISEHSKVSEVAVVGIPDDKWGEVVTAFVVPLKNTDLEIEELKLFCSEKLGGYKIPKRFIVLEGLPKTHVGKIDKKQLQKMDVLE